MTGALMGTRVIEMGGPPGAFGTMLLADHGADVIRIARPTQGASVGAVTGLAKGSPMDRGKRALAIDLSHPAGPETLLTLAEHADVFVEGFRPGVAERRGIGPADCLARNPRLVYARMTGWGQEGPWAQRAGHDVNYVSLSGTLSTIGMRAGPPVIPLNYLGDWAGGMLLAFGIVCALHEVHRSGRGQVVDAAMIDAATILASIIHGALSRSEWTEERESNMVDGGTPYYRIYETADGKYVAVGALEPQFYAELVNRMGLADAGLPAQDDPSRWDDLRAALAKTFASKTRDEWEAIMEGADACFAPVLGLNEARHHPHNMARQAFVEHDGVVQPAPAPRLKGTPASIRGWDECNVPLEQALRDWGLAHGNIDDLRASGAVGPAATSE